VSVPVTYGMSFSVSCIEHSKYMYYMMLTYAKINYYE
jgi:hypothetical protein